MNNDSVLEPGQSTLLDLKLDDLRRELRALEAPASIEDALAAKFRAQQRRPRFWWMPPIALAATIALASWIVRGPVTDNQGLVSLAPTMIDSDPPFLALRPLANIAGEKGAHVVTTEFPRALLADWGLPVPPERAGEPVRAEMLYSASGEPLAVRLLD